MTWTSVYPRCLLALLGLALLLSAAFFGVLWEFGYWSIRDCVEEAWRMGYNGCYVSERGTTYSGGAAYMMWPSLALLALALACFWFAVRPRRKGAIQ